MKKLDLNQMENLNGGMPNKQQIGCAASLVGLALTYAGAFTITAATGGAGLFAAAFIVGSIGVGTSC